LNACIVGDEDLLRKLRKAGPFKGKIIGIEMMEGAPYWHNLMFPLSPSDAAKISALRDAIDPGKLATIIYTSGSTGFPKGVMLSHANIVSNVKAVLAIVPVHPGSQVLSFLPISHIFERMVTLVYVAAGASIWFAGASDDLPATFKAVRPQFFTAVPRILERAFDTLLDQRNKLGLFGKKVFDWAVALGERFPVAGRLNMMPLSYRLQLLVANWLVFRHWRDALGGRVEAIAVGAAALQPRLARLFSAAGIDVREGYGLTETSPVVSFNRFEPGGVQLGTVGIPAPGVEVRIMGANESGVGEIEVRGPNVMMGYWNLPEDTAERFTADGWFKTGDLGQIVHKRFLQITGRLSEVFKTSGGKFVAPAFVEQQLLTSPYIDQCAVFGANQPYVAALILPDFVKLEAWCHANKVHWTAPAYMIHNPKVEKLFRREIDRINEEALAAVEKVRAFRLLSDSWTTESGVLTTTLKPRRGALWERYSVEIEEMYGNSKK
ncbi:MAG TPA: AMP-binding protein, partial [Saprospiraceae bacterium]|nr:AMP-binding protein [Saprospiraceae bacterium]